MTGVLIDTSVWVAHFRQSQAELVRLLALDGALMHPLVQAELACGTPPEPRVRTLADLGLLPPVRQASLTEVMAFVERERLYGLGCGVVDLARREAGGTEAEAPLQSINPTAWFIHESVQP